MTAEEPARPGAIAPERAAHVEQASQRLASLVVLRQIQLWLQRDAADQRLQARAWRLAWVVLGVILLAAVVFGLKQGWRG